jgi:NAD(P)-dependent dehydrogenase (short-subunit alcohol dehydrogenase family)
MEIKDRVIVVTGGASGIQGHAERCARRCVAWSSPTSTCRR